MTIAKRNKKQVMELCLHQTQPSQENISFPLFLFVLRFSLYPTHDGRGKLIRKSLTYRVGQNPFSQAFDIGYR